MSKLTKAMMLLFSAVFMLGLTACNTAQQRTPEAPATTVQQAKPQERDYNRFMYNGEGDYWNAEQYLFNAKKKLTDGRTVECVVLGSGGLGGIDCDFAGASVSK
jgi:hypothetical protein